MTHPDHAPNIEIVDDFDAFWLQYTDTQPRVRILGCLVPVPFDIPLRVQQQIEHGGEQNLDTLITMVRELYGHEQAEAWIAAGAGAQQLSIILAWTMLRVQGENVTFAEAMVKAQQMADEQAKADAAKAERRRVLNEAAGNDPHALAALDAHEQAVRDAGKALYGGTGPLSAPTSAVSTGSTVTSSPASAFASSTRY
mgnify:FL=1